MRCIGFAHLYIKTYLEIVMVIDYLFQHYLQKRVLRISIYAD